MVDFITSKAAVILFMIHMYYQYMRRFDLNVFLCDVYSSSESRSASIQRFFFFLLHIEMEARLPLHVTK